MWRDKPARRGAQADDDGRRASDGDTPAAGEEEEDEARLFYERLEQTGRLVDVNDATDISTLDPRVTHVRRPDGTIERIGFA